MRTKITPKARDDVAFSCGKRFKPSVGYFFGRFGSLLEFFLLGNDMELRFRGARAERANADAVGLHFFGKPFGEEKIEGFRGGVSGNVGDGLEGGGGSEDEHIAAAAPTMRCKKRCVRCRHAAQFTCTMWRRGCLSA